MANTHTIVRASLPHDEVGALLAADYGMRPISSLTIGDIRKPGEPPAHMLYLVEDVNRRGITDPVVVRVTATRRTVVDGHHRAVIAHPRKWNLDADIVHCDHPDDQNCPIVRDLCNQHHQRTVANGWAWEPEA